MVDRHAALSPKAAATATRATHSASNSTSSVATSPQSLQAAGNVHSSAHSSLARPRPLSSASAVQGSDKVAGTAASPPALPVPPQLSLADALEEAQQRMADLLRHPDDLSLKLVQLKTKFASEKASVDAVLKSAVQGQLDDTQQGLGLLQTARQTITAVHNHLQTVDTICLDSRSIIHNYAKIRMVSRTHQNFLLTRAMVQQFQQLNRDIESICAMLDDDEREPLGQHPHLLPMHHQLFRLEKFRDEAVLRAKQQDASVHQIILRYFKKLDAVSERFRNHLWSVGKSMLDLLRENQGSVVVRLGKIIEVEELADEKVLISEQIRSSNPQLSESGQFKVLSENPRTIKNYRSQLFNAIHEHLALHFMNKVSQTDDVVETLQKVQFVFEELAVVFEELGPRFPPKYQIFSFYVIQYHRHVYDLLNRLTSRNLETRDILMVTSWVRDYYRMMNQRFGVGEELLEPRLLDGKEEELISEYVALIRKKLNEWVDRLLDSEMHDFVSREKPPETEGDSMYCTSASVILFQMINQQIDIAIESSQGGRLLSDVARECFAMARYFQDRQQKMMDAEHVKFQKGDPEFPPGFPEYVVAVANNHFKCNEFMEVLQKRLDTSLDEKWRGEASQFTQETMDGFVRVSKAGGQILQEIMFHDIGPVMQALFTPAWYEKPHQIPSVISTLDDYFKDFKAHLNDYLFSKLTTESMDRFLITWLEAFRGKQTKFKLPQAVGMIKSDIAQSIQFWSEYKTAKRVKQAFDLLEKVVELLESSSSMIFLSWYSIWKVYSDVPMVFVEEVLQKRDDLDKATVKEAIQNCKNKAKEGHAESGTTSLFSKM